MIKPIFRAATALALLAVTSWAAAGAPADKATTDKLRAALTNPAMGMEIATVETSVIPGLYEVQFTNGPVVYSTANGEHFIVGDVFAVNAQGYTNLTEQRRDTERLEKLAKVDEKDMIIFSPEGETRGHLTVFTDVSCFYCQKLHKEDLAYRILHDWIAARCPDDPNDAPKCVRIEMEPATAELFNCNTNIVKPRFPTGCGVFLCSRVNGHKL